MIKHVIKILLAFYCLQFVSLSQDLNEAVPVKVNNVNTYDSKYLLQEELKQSKSSTTQNNIENIQKAELYRYSFDMMQKSRTIKEESSFNIVSSFRQNIRFGGFWDRYAIVNFTPDMFIKPFDFISIYAVHNSSYFIPIKAVKEHFKLMAIQSAAVLAIDNSIKYLLPVNKMIKAIAGFVLKNVVMNSLLDKIINSGKDRIFEQGSYYCAVSFRF